MMQKIKYKGNAQWSTPEKITCDLTHKDILKAVDIKTLNGEHIGTFDFDLLETVRDEYFRTHPDE